MEAYNLGYRSLTFWGQPPQTNALLKGIASKASHKAKIMLAREKTAILAGSIKSLDGTHAMMRRERIGKYGCVRNLIEPSPVSIVRNTRKVTKVDGKPKEAEYNVVNVNQGAPKKTFLAKKPKEYVFRFGEKAITTAI